MDAQAHLDKAEEILDKTGTALDDKTTMISAASVQASAFLALAHLLTSVVKAMNPKE